MEFFLSLISCLKIVVCKTECIFNKIPNSKSLTIMRLVRKIWNCKIQLKKWECWFKYFLETLSCSIINEKGPKQQQIKCYNCGQFKFKILSLILTRAKITIFQNIQWKIINLSTWHEFVYKTNHVNLRCYTYRSLGTKVDNLHGHLNERHGELLQKTLLTVLL